MVGLSIYGGKGGWPSLSKISSKLPFSNSNLTTLPPETVLSITSQKRLSDKINLLPIRTFLAGLTRTSHKRSPSSLKRKISTFASVLSFVA